MSSGRLFFAVCVMFSCYFVYTAGAAALRSHRIASDEASAIAQVVQLESDKAHLEATLRYVSSDAYVEQEARRSFGYVRDGEIAVVVDSPEPESEPTQGGAWWERLFPR